MLTPARNFSLFPNTFTQLIFDLIRDVFEERRKHGVVAPEIVGGIELIEYARRLHLHLVRLPVIIQCTNDFERAVFDCFHLDFLLCFFVSKRGTLNIYCRIVNGSGLDLPDFETHCDSEY